MSDKNKIQNNDEQEMIENLDILMDMDIFEAEDDWKHLKQKSDKDHHSDET